MLKERIESETINMMIIFDMMYYLECKFNMKNVQ